MKKTLECRNMYCKLKYVVIYPKLLQYCFSSRGTSLFWKSHRYKEGEIPKRKVKYPVLRTKEKCQELIKHTKLSYSIASVLCRKFSCRPSRNGLIRGTSKLSTASTSKSTSRVNLIPFVRIPHFSILVHMMQYLKNLSVSWI